MLNRATSKLTHNPTLTVLRGTNQDMRLLQNLILAEKTVLITLQKLSVDLASASDALRAWSLNEGDDLSGILTASTVPLNHFSSALSQYAEHGHSIRRQLKVIRTRAESLENLKRNKVEAKRKAERFDGHMRRMNPKNKNFEPNMETLNGLWKDVRELEFEVKLEEAAFGDFKRTATKIWMGLKFGGLVECCEKGMIAGKFGKFIIAEIPEGMTQPGLPRNVRYRRSQVEGCVSEAHRGISGVTLSTVPFVAFRDRNEYFQRSSETDPSDAPAFYISPPNNNSPRVSIESRLHPTSNDHPGELQPPLADNARPFHAAPSLLGESQFRSISNNERSLQGELLQPPLAPMGLDADNLRAIQPSSSHIPPQAAPSLSGEPQFPPTSNNGRPIHGESIQPPLSPMRLNADNASHLQAIQPSSLRNQPLRSILSNKEVVVAPQTLPSSRQPEVDQGAVVEAVRSTGTTTGGGPPEASSKTAAVAKPTPTVPVPAPTVSVPAPTVPVPAPTVPVRAATVPVPAPTVPVVEPRMPGKFGGSKPDPFSMRVRYPVAVRAPEPPKPVVEKKPGSFARFFRALWGP